MKLSVLVLAGCSSIGDSAPDGPTGGSPGTLVLAYSSTPSGGQFSPLNCSVAWIESPGGTLIKTIDRKCGIRSVYLIAWGTKSGGEGADVDAVTGGSRVDHATPISITWDLRDRLGGIVADDTLTIRMESTEGNATSAAQNNQGAFTFTKGSQVVEERDLSNGGFVDLSLTYTPP